ncbi:MAG: 3-phosphoshikimate 1-carboxyvinyltransferase [Alphaproteobacteria bacterium]|nr:3-phosphoshikimate 1-carboxyvinyltransferase [Alphaproteobacteria bacterium]
MTDSENPEPLTSHPVDVPLEGTVTVPGDKSISHRALMIGAVSVGRTSVRGLLEGEDVLATAAALRALGVTVTCADSGTYLIDGVGLSGLAEPTQVLDLGNSGTGARLLLGLLATHPLTAQVTGDASLVERPMNRVIEPLSRMGAGFTAREGGRLPLTVTGARLPVPITYELPVPSAQVKSAILLAGLNAPGETTVIEPEATRDHTELMLRHFGAAVAVEDGKGGARRITVGGFPELEAHSVVVPGDPSSAAFAAVGALIRAGSDVTIPNVGINPLRTGLYMTLIEMGADITFDDERTDAGEPVADLKVRASRLHGVEVPAARAPSMIDEYPILAVAAAFAEGTTVMRGLSELRVKESDRIAAITGGLAAIGARFEEGDDTLAVHGTGRPPPGNASVATHFDHRISMSFLVSGIATEGPVTVDDGRAIATSFPGFVELMNGLGARITGADRE